MRIFAVTSYGPHSPLTGGRQRREHLLAGLADRGHEVDRLTLAARPGPATGLRSVLASVDRSVAARISQAHVVLLADVFTAPLVLRVRRAGVPVVLDLCDSPYRLVGAAPRRTLAERATYLSAQAQLIPVMHGLAPLADRLTYTSEEDAQIDRAFVRRLPPCSVVPAGIAPELFDLPLEPAEDHGYIGWTADWDYPPNRDALRWFAQEVAPLVPEPVLDRLRLFGPRDPLPALGPASGRLRYAGFAPSLSALYGGAVLLIAPTLWGAGTKTKVLEPLAAGRPVLTTPEGLTGLPPSVANCVDVADADPAAFARAMDAVLAEPFSHAHAARRRDAVRDRTWEASVRAMESVLLAAYEERGGTGGR